MRRIAHGADGVTVTADGLEVRARRAIVALPPTLAGRIAYDPPLPGFRDQLTQRMAQGTVIKCMAIYQEPFWRAEGLTGQGTSDVGPVRVTFDNSPPDGRRGCCSGSSRAAQARTLGRRTPEERRDAVVGCFARLFGPRAASPDGYVERVWADEEWTRGCYGCAMPTGAWTEFGPALRAPIGPLHWAGAETATVWSGYMDGAVSVGRACRRGRCLRARRLTSAECPSRRRIPGGGVPPVVSETAVPQSTPAQTNHAKLRAWVEEVAALTQPDAIDWCDGSAEEYDALCQTLVDAGTFERLSDAKRPNSYLARSDPATSPGSRTARSSAREREEDAGPTNNWRDPAEMRETLRELFGGVDAGPHDVRRARSRWARSARRSPTSASRSPTRPTSPSSMRIMTRMGQARPRRARRRRATSCPACTRSARRWPTGEADVPWPCNADNKYIVHFPETREIWSYGSGYGGNALLGKKCFALRIASVMARDEGWLAEHMLILKLTSPEGEVKHIAAAFPSACGKTNLAMLSPTLPGWKVETVGDDIAWMRFGDDGRLYAINPEAGLLRRRAGHRREDQPQRDRDAATGTASSPTSR